MEIRISNRVFWAAVFLAGCAILSGRAGSQDAKGKDGTFDTLTVKHLIVVNKDDNPRGFFEMTDSGGAELLLFGTESRKKLSVRAFADNGSAFLTVEDDKNINFVTAKNTKSVDAAQFRKELDDSHEQ